MMRTAWPLSYMRTRAGGSGGSTPAYVSKGTTSGSLTPTYQAGINAGDMLIAVIVVNGNIPTDYDPPSGFARLTGAHFTNGTGVTGAVFAWYKIAAGTESGNTATFTQVGSAIVNNHQAWILRFTGATGIEGLQAYHLHLSSTEALTSPAITTSVGSALIVNLWGGFAQSLTEEAGWTEHVEDTVGFGAGACMLSVHSTAGGAAGAQTTEEPTPSSTTGKICISFALKPSGTTSAQSLTLRGTSKLYVNGSSGTISLPSGSQAGDRLIVFSHQAWDLGTLSTRMPVIDRQSGSFTNGAIHERLLTPGDITNGSVTIDFGGSFQGDIMALAYQGCTGGIRTIASTRNSSNSSPRTVTTGSLPQSGDDAIYFGGNRANSTNTINQGSSRQTDSQANASAALYSGAVGSSGAISANFTYGTLGSGDYQAIAVVRPAGA